MDLDKVDLDSMTPEQLEQLEDNAVAEDAGVEVKPVVVEQKTDALPGDEVKKPEDDKTGTPEEVVAPKEEVQKTELTPEQEEIQQHVSPPSKWAAERHAKRELQEELKDAKSKVAEFDDIRTELDDIKEKFNWMKTTISDKGIVLPESPAEVFSDEKIAEVRDEFGDEIADMFKATAAMLNKQHVAKTEPEKAAGEEIKAPVETPGDKKEEAGEELTGDTEIIEAIKGNDELSWWAKKSPVLWKRAQDKDTELATDPEYIKLSYADRYKKVVESVKADVTTGSGLPGSVQGDGSGLPTSLSDANGKTGTHNQSSAVDRVFAAANQDEQLKIYDSLSQAEKDEVDLALNI